ncbi:MAG: murein biosynthesis integral membrane protein MurJ [Candidatus Omnitrophica bacterium]|nr:murein biosynthesis integral membrane protein MurJ [Candidatus Omnitrophota bacterium]
MSLHKSIIKSASLISTAIFCSRILGFIRDIIIAAFFGTGMVVEAFFVAFRIPNMLRDLIGEGAANAAFVPVFCEYQAKNKREDFWRLIEDMFWLLLIFLSILTLLGIIFSKPLVSIIAPGFLKEPQKLSLTVQLTRVLFPYLILIGLTAYGMGILHTFKSFTAPAFGASLLNLAMIGSVIFAYSKFTQPIYALALGVLVGGILQVAIQVPFLKSKGMQLVLRKPVFSQPGIKKIVRLLIPRIFGAAVYQLNVFVDTILASLSFIVGSGAVAAIYYANRIIQFPLALFGIALSSAVLPTISRYAAEKDLEGIKSSLGFSLRSLYFMMLPASLGILILAQPLIKVFFQRGQFDLYSTQITSNALTFYALGLVFFGWVKLMIAGFHSLQDTKTPVKCAFLSLLLNIVLDIILIFPLRVGGLALASSIAGAFNFFLLHSFLKKRIGTIFNKKLSWDFLKIGFAALAMGFCLKFFFSSVSSYINYGLALFLAIVLAIVSYFIFCWLLKIEEAVKLIKWLKERR